MLSNKLRSASYETDASQHIQTLAVPILSEVPVLIKAKLYHYQNGLERTGSLQMKASETDASSSTKKVAKK